MVGRKKNHDRLRTARQLDRLKWETAEQLGLDDNLKSPDELSVREAGKIGGQMTRKLVRKGEQSMSRESARKTDMKPSGPPSRP